ncbi:mannose-6-phosphate isomerase, class I [Kineosporia sp. J2-2]|uniref:mannose-6-phosphate isomerase n=1 Tax=Kineosporia corallincola TaxID=2835133 RepID=A0ABS5TSM7_9ACTN|nr:mannose-6-phosphate isomerase, class I [Kineosporia corallincola]MBT0773769.1 mannose-6-phosphate isomerase, class I [Kineosporia corallincola]
MDILDTVVQPYAWGSRTVIAGIQGRSVPSEGPEAELWMGSHPSAPSKLTRDGQELTLDQVVAADPDGELGRACAERFGGRLPFLMKILAAEKALSIQVHPDRPRAEAGFAEENARGLVRGEAARNYVDDWPKPEVLCAVTPFEVLAGFREPREAARLMRDLEVGRLAPAAGELEATGDLKAVLEQLLNWPADDREALVGEVVAACSRVTGPAAYDAVVRMSADHPGDLGLVASLLMRHQVVEPGQALFMAAGGLHAYIRGTGVELLANSDNVLRAGLTPKHVDVPELLRLVDPAVEVPVVAPRPLGDGVYVYDTPVPEFRLHRIEAGDAEVTLPGEGPRIVLCLTGSAVLRRAGGESVKLEPSRSCFLPDGDGVVTASGPGELFVAGTGDLA